MGAARVSGSASAATAPARSTDARGMRVVRGGTLFTTPLGTLLLLPHYGVASAMSEKRKPTYDLSSVQTWASSANFVVTGTVRRSGAALGFGMSEMASVIETMQREHFHKSVTSFGDHREWQDVYLVPNDVGTLYIKFRSDVVTEFVLLSFKEKDNG